MSARNGRVRQPASTVSLALALSRCLVSDPLNTLPNAPLPTCSSMAYSWRRGERRHTSERAASSEQRAASPRFMAHCGVPLLSSPLCCPPCSPLSVVSSADRSCDFLFDCLYYVSSPVCRFGRDLLDVLSDEIAVRLAEVELALEIQQDGAHHRLQSRVLGRHQADDTARGAHAEGEGGRGRASESERASAVEARRGGREAEGRSGGTRSWR